MAVAHPPTLGQFVSHHVVSEQNFIDLTAPATEAGFHFTYTGMSQAAYYQAIDVPGRIDLLSSKDLTRQLLKQVWYAARKHPHQSQVRVTVCKPPTTEDVYVNQPLSLMASIEHNHKQQPVLIITTLEELPS